MTGYEIKFHQVTEEARKMTVASRSLNSHAHRLRSIAGELEDSNSSMDSVKNRLYDQSRRVGALSDHIKSRSGVTLEAVRLYQEGERQAGNVFGIGDQAMRHKGEGWDTLAQAGFGGSFLALAGRPIAQWHQQGSIAASAGNPAYHLQVLKDGSHSMEKLYEYGTIRTAIANPSSLLAETYQKKSMIAGGFAVGFTGALKGYENYTRYQNGEISALRAARNTLHQTTVEVAKNKVLLKAAVFGGKVVAGVAGAKVAPVVLAGAAIYFGGSYLLNRAAPDGDFARVVSDGIIDAKDAVAGYITDSLKNVKNIVSPIGSSIARWAFRS